MNLLAGKISSVFYRLASFAGSSALCEKNYQDMTVWERIALFFKSMWRHMYTWFIDLIFNLIYSIGKFVLNIVDFLALAVKELAGQNVISDLSNIKKASQVDMVFRFVFDGPAWGIFKALIGLAVVLLIVFTIIAFFKNEYDAFIGGSEDNSKGQIVKRTLSSLFLIIIVPFMAIGGVLLSNAVLASVNNALGRRSENSTIASEVFIASTYQANQYRIYADKGKRVPIVFDFESVDSEDLKLPEGGSNSQMNSSMQSYLNKGVWSRGVNTWWQFYNELFFSFADIKQAEVENADRTDIVAWTDFFDKGMQPHQVEYYVMADVSDYLVRKRESLYVVNAYKLAEQMGLQDNDGNQSPFIGYKVSKQKDASGNEVEVKERVYSLKEANLLTFRVYYDSKLASTLPDMQNEGGNWFVEYTFNNTHDEAQGAMYLLCTLEEKEVNGVKEFIYHPLRSYEKKVNYYSGHFWSDYLAPNQMVVARGCFNDENYPTAIRDVGGRVEFYRDEVRAPMLLDLLPQITYEPQEGKFDLASGINWVFQTITGLDISEFIPKVYFRDDAWNFFTKRTETVAEISAGELFLDYNFNNGVPLYGVVKISEINLIVLIFAAIMLVSVLGKAMFGLISRVFDLVLLFITYPVFASTMPLDEGARFKSWTETFVGKVLGAYGIIIGLNLVFILLPIIAEFNAFFSLEFVTNNMRPTTMSPQTLTTLMNFGVWLMFYLVAFTFIKTAGGLISGLLGGSDAMKDGEQVIGDIKNVVQKTTNVVSGKVLVDGAKKLKGDIVGFIPGSAAIGAVAGNDARKARKEKRDVKADISARRAEFKGADKGVLGGRLADDKKKEEKDKAKKKKEDQDKKLKDMLAGK